MSKPRRKCESCQSEDWVMRVNTYVYYDEDGMEVDRAEDAEEVGWECHHCGADAPDEPPTPPTITVTVAELYHLLYVEGKRYDLFVEQEGTPERIHGAKEFGEDPSWAESPHMELWTEDRWDNPHVPEFYVSAAGYAPVFNANELVCVRENSEGGSMIINYDNEEDPFLLVVDEDGRKAEALLRPPTTNKELGLRFRALHVKEIKSYLAVLEVARFDGGWVVEFFADDRYRSKVRQIVERKPVDRFQAVDFKRFAYSNYNRIKKDGTVDRLLADNGLVFDGTHVHPAATPTPPTQDPPAQG